MNTDRASRLKCSRREALGLLLSGGLAGRSFGNIGPAFHYQAVFTAESEAWYIRFPILVTGNILSDKQSRNLRVNGTKLVAYCWTSAYYPGDEVSAPLDWQARVQRNRGAWLLNREPQAGGAAAPGRVADWYDFGSAELIAERARHLTNRLTAAGYDGFFFDTLGASQLPKPVLAHFLDRHPGLDYDAAQGYLLREVRKQLPPGKLIFTNQGYRHPEAFLPHADLDLSESYFTSIDSNGETTFRQWHSPEAPWSSVKTPMERLVLPAVQRYPHIRFVHLNYAAGQRAVIQRAISYSYACAKLFQHDAYLVTPGLDSAERDEIYFSDLGNAVSPTYYERTEQCVAWREYQKGIVAINSGSAAAVLPYHGLKLLDPPRGRSVRRFVRRPSCAHAIRCRGAVRQIVDDTRHCE